MTTDPTETDEQPADRTELRDRAHEAAVSEMREIYSGQIPDSSARQIADAVLAVLPAGADQTAENDALSPQSCAAGKHADWAVDSEHTHACPWCAVEQLRADRAASGSGRVAEAEQDHPGADLFSALQGAGYDVDEANARMYAYARMVLRQEKATGVPPARADRAAVLAEAVDAAETVAMRLHDAHEIERENGAYDVHAELRRMADETGQDAAPAVDRSVWIDGDPLLEAIAAAVYERCEHADSGLIIDDPRNIAVAALSAVVQQDEAPQCDVEFEGGGQCIKPAGHRPPGSDDPHTPAAVVQQPSRACTACGHHICGDPSPCRAITHVSAVSDEDRCGCTARAAVVQQPKEA